MMAGVDIVAENQAMENLVSFEVILFLLPFAIFVIVALMAKLVGVDWRAVGDPIDVDVTTLFADGSGDGGD